MAGHAGSRKRVYFNLPEAELRRRLEAGSEREIIQGHLGKKLYSELRELAKSTRNLHRTRRPRVYILHGIMGSLLGYPRRHEVLWIDPDALAAGRLTELALPRGQRVRPLGVQIFMYLKLKLSLERAGFDVRFHAYDWRRDVLSLGRQLMQRLRADSRAPVAIVAHSMGGLVARAALPRDRDRQISRLIMLGTPNFGSFAAALALRGAYPPVHKIALLDHEHGPEHPVEAPMPRAKVPDAQRCARTIVQQGLDDRGVALVALFGRGDIGHVDVAVAVICIATQQRAENRITIQPRQARPHDASGGVDQRRDLAVADGRQIERRRRHGALVSRSSEPSQACRTTA